MLYFFRHLFGEIYSNWIVVVIL